MPSPAEIQQQIETTRAELAQTIDAIAEIVSPRRVARRGVEQLKEKVEELRTRTDGSQAAILDRQTTNPGQRQLPAGVSRQLDKVTTYAQGRRIRWDRVAIVAGGVVVIVWWRRRSHGE